MPDISGYNLQPSLVKTITAWPEQKNLSKPAFQRKKVFYKANSGSTSSSQIHLIFTMS